MFQGKGGCGGPLAQLESYCLATAQESEYCSVVMCVLGLKAFGADHGSNEGPHVDDETDPAGGHLDPEN